MKNKWLYFLMQTGFAGCYTYAYSVFYLTNANVVPLWSYIPGLLGTYIATSLLIFCFRKIKTAALAKASIVCCLSFYFLVPIIRQAYPLSISNPDGDYLATLSQVIASVMPLLSLIFGLLAVSLLLLSWNKMESVHPSSANN